jgi:transcriptional regulator with XRE-family HTH domain
MDSATHKVQVGQRLRIAIEAIPASQVSVSKALGVAPSKLGNWIRGDNYPDPWFIYQFCDRYGVTADWIYRGQVSGAMATNLADALWAAEQALREGAPEGATMEGDAS